MSDPSISVIMSAYNVEKYIGEAIESILNQTFNDFEFIIIDDASMDGTLSVIQKFKDDRIKIIRNESNMKLAASLNRGLRVACGKYMARMDADDVSHLRRLEKLYSFLEKNHDIDICGTNMKIFGRREGVWDSQIDDVAIKANLIWTSPVAHATVMMRLDTIRKHGLYYDETFKVGQDWKYWYDAKDVVRFANIPEVLYYYRRDEQSITLQFSHESPERYAAMYKIMLHDLGISFTERELGLHQFIIAQYRISPSPKVVKDARTWLNKIISYNEKTKKYDIRVFKEISEQKWSHLFYRIVPYGFSTVFAYFIVTGVSRNHLMYYLKYLLNKFIGRK